MRVVAYVDVWPGMDPRNAYVMSEDTHARSASPIVGGGKRYRLTFEVPDPGPDVAGDAQKVIVENVTAQERKK